MASKSGSKPSSPRSFPRTSNIRLLQNYIIVKVKLKTMWGETESWSVLFVGGGWRGREGGRVVTWEGGKGGKGMRLVRSECSEVARWERWEVPSFIQGWGAQDESKTSSFCF